MIVEKCDAVAKDKMEHIYEFKIHRLFLNCSTSPFSCCLPNFQNIYLLAHITQECFYVEYRPRSGLTEDESRPFLQAKNTSAAMVEAQL